MSTLDAHGTAITPADLRHVVLDICGHDPGPLEPAHRLADVGLTGCDLLAGLAAIEHGFGVAFPHDLVEAIDTVDDLVYYTTIKQGHD